MTKEEVVKNLVSICYEMEKSTFLLQYKTSCECTINRIQRIINELESDIRLQKTLDKTILKNRGVT